MDNFNTIANQVNNMTPEQYLAFIESFAGEVPADIQALSDEDLLEALGV